MAVFLLCLYVGVACVCVCIVYYIVYCIVYLCECMAAHTDIFMCSGVFYRTRVLMSEIKGRIDTILHQQY